MRVDVPLSTCVRDFSTWRLAGVVAGDEELELLNTELEELELELEEPEETCAPLDSELELNELLDATELLLMLELLVLELEELEETMEELDAELHMLEEETEEPCMLESELADDTLFKDAARLDDGILLAAELELTKTELDTELYAGD